MPTALSPWNFGPLSPATDSILSMRVLSLPFGDYTAQTMRQQLEASLNDGAFQGRVPEGSGSQYIVSARNKVLTSATLRHPSLKRAVVEGGFQLLSHGLRRVVSERETQNTHGEN